MKKVERYKCDFCSKLYAKKETMEYHESICLKNPKRTSCGRVNCAGVVPYDDERIKEIQEVYDENEWNGVFDLLHGCPVCVLHVYMHDVIDAHSHYDYAKYRDKAIREEEQEFMSLVGRV